MKKLIEKLFRNSIFKKVTMGIVFVLMCSFACFLNWKAVVGAEGEGGGETQTTGTFTLDCNDFGVCYPSIETDWGGWQSITLHPRVEKIEYDWGENDSHHTLKDYSGCPDTDNDNPSYFDTFNVPFESGKPLNIYFTMKSNHHTYTGDLTIVDQYDHLEGTELFDVANDCTYDNETRIYTYTFKMSPENVEKVLSRGNTNKGFRVVPRKSVAFVEIDKIKEADVNMHGDAMYETNPYDYINIKYQNQSYEYVDWPVNTATNSYGHLAFCSFANNPYNPSSDKWNYFSDRRLKMSIEGKTNDFDIKNLNYLCKVGGPVHSDDTFSPWDSEDNVYRNSSPLHNVANDNVYHIGFKGIIHVLRVLDADNNSLYDKLEVKYKIGVYDAYDTDFKDFNVINEYNPAYNMELGTFASASIPLYATKVALAVKQRPGYDVSDTKYFVDLIHDSNSPPYYEARPNRTVASNWKELGTVSNDGWFIINLEISQSPIVSVAFKDFAYTRTQLRFRDSEENEINPGIATISPGGQTTVSDYEVNGISTTMFLVTLGEDCGNGELRINNFSLKEPVQYGSVDLSGVWNDRTQKFELKVDVRSSDPEVTIILSSVSTKMISFTFKEESGSNFPLILWEPEHERYATISDDHSVQDFIEVHAGDDLVFSVKTADYAYWTGNYAGSTQNPEIGEPIFNLFTVERGYMDSATSEYISDSDMYKITLKGVHQPGREGRNFIEFKKGVCDTHNINISFTEVNLPEDVNDGVEGHKKIEVKQGDKEYSYPDRGSSRYTVKATIKPISGDVVEKATLISLNPELDNMCYFADGRFIFGDTEFTGNVSGGNKVCSFNLARIPGAYHALKSGDLNIQCLGLKPRDKKVNVVSVGFEGITIKDDRNNSYSPDGEGKYTVPYGSILKIRATVSGNYDITVPENQFKAYIIDENGQVGNYITNWTIDRVSETSITVSFAELLTTDIGVEFIADSNNLPISFKNADGIEYYYVNMRVNEDGKNELITANPITQENGSNKILRGIEKINSGNDYYFAVGVKPGYDIDNLTIKSNGKIINAYKPDGSEDYIVEGCKFYKLENVETSITITGLVGKSTVTVTFNNTSRGGEEAKLKYNSDNSDVNLLNATYGNSVTFTVSFENQDKYGQSDFKVHVKNKNDPSYPEGNENVLTKYQGEYKILDITEDKEVYVTGVSINKYVVNFVSSNRAGFLIDSNSFQGTREVTHGSNIEFRIKAKEGYQLGKETVVNYQSASGDSEISKNKGSSDKYTLSGIKENCTITIDNVDNIIYKVNFKDVPGATYLNEKGSIISGGSKVKYGGNFEFSVNVDDAYDDSAAGMFIILNNGKSKLHAQKLASGRYMVSNITEDLNIKVGNIRKNTYTVTLRNEEGIDYYNSNDKVINGDNTVNHGDSFSFRVSLYPAYSDSKIAVMLGTEELSADSNGYYTIPGVVEDKIVTVTGIHPNTEVSLINTINNLPSSVNDLNDVNPVIEASRWYNSLSDEQRARVTNADVLMNLQQQAGVLLHNSDGVTVDGADWYIKLVVVPISSDMDACTRIYKKLTSEYILSLYDIYLWDTLNDVKYTSYGDQVYTVTIPTPKLTNFRNPTGVHEDSNSGKVSFMDLIFNGDTVSFETNSFSAMGVVASHDASGVSSLLDTPGANIPWIRDYIFGGARSGGSGNDSSGNTLLNDDDGSAGDGAQDTGNINDKFKSINNRVTPQGSALRLVLVLLILILLALALWLIYKKRKEREE